MIRDDGNSIILYVARVIHAEENGELVLVGGPIEIIDLDQDSTLVAKNVPETLLVLTRLAPSLAEPYPSGVNRGIME